MATVRGVEGREPDQAMCSVFRTQIAIGIATADLNGRALDTGLFTLAIVIDLRAEFMAFGPAQVHAQEHLGPVLGVHTAAACVNAHNSVALIMLSIEH